MSFSRLFRRYILYPMRAETLCEASSIVLVVGMNGGDTTLRGGSKVMLLFMCGSNVQSP